MVRYSAGGGRSTALTSVIVNADNQSVALALATGQVKMKSAYREYECHPSKIEQLRN